GRTSVVSRRKSFGPSATRGIKINLWCFVIAAGESQRANAKFNAFPVRSSAKGRLLTAYAPRAQARRLGKKWLHARFWRKQIADSHREARQNFLAAQLIGGAQPDGGLTGAVDANGSSDRVQNPNQRHTGGLVIVQFLIQFI